MNEHLHLLRSAVGVALVWALAGCTAKVVAPAPAVCSAKQGNSSDATSLAADDTAFALAFYPPAVTAAGSSGNVIVSPYSVSATMTMVDVGAAGQTESQMESVLHLPGTGAAVAPAYAALACEMESDGFSSGNELLVANSLWAQKGYSFEPSFESVLESGYGAPLQQVDFSNTAGAVASINGWVSGKTQGQIPDLLQPSNVDGSTRLVLVSAVYFKGAWASAFDASQTAPQPFTLSDGSQVPVTTMSGKVNLRLGGTPTMQLVELAYKGGALAMDVLLPAGTTTDLPAFEATLTPAALTGALTSLGPVESVQLHMPKFSFRTSLGLIPVLAGMGMTDVFAQRVANLSGIDGKMDLYVSAVVHQALVEVDEQGTVAAAATAAVVSRAQCGGCGGEPLVLRVDTPFVFLVRDTQSGGILFLGHVTDPRH
jgi:serpin B